MPGELSPASLAANLACLLHLARHKPGAEDELQEAGRVLLCALDGRVFSMVATTGWLSINENKLPSSSPGVRDVNESLLGHGVSRLELAEPLELSDALLLARTLAAFPGTFNWEELLASLGPVVRRLKLTRAGSDLAVIRFHDVETEMLPPTAREREILAKLHEKPVVDEGGLILPPMAIEPPDPAPKAAAEADRRAEARRVEQLVAAGRSAIDSGDNAALLRIAGELLDGADQMGNEAQARMTRLELKRLLSRHHIAQFARMAATGSQKELAVDVLRRLGSDATEILMDLLIETEAMAERRGYFSALTRMEDGTDIIIHHLDHPMWYVVRNAAELCAEMRLALAVPQLAKQAAHPDERVRRSVALALARIGTSDALEPISRMLKDASPQVRLQVLGNLDGSKARPLAMPLAALLQTEEHPDVLREVLRVLGRIGTPDALLALRRVALGDKRRFGKRVRLQAIESLATVGPSGAQILRSLAGDADSDIGNAAAGGEIYGGSEEVAAEAGEARLPPEQLTTWIGRYPSGTPDQGVAGFVALAWVDYSLLAEAASRGSLTDSATAAAALVPDLMLVPMRRWHDTLVARRPRVPADLPDSMYVDDQLRVFQHIFFRISDPQDVRANNQVRERAESLLVKVRAPGADFAALAREHSEDASGALGGWLPPSRRGAFPPEFSRGSWRIKPGEVQGIISRGGFHIVRRPALEEVRERLRQYAESLATRQADSLYVDSLTAARGLALGPDVPGRLRAFFNQPSVRTEDREPLARWEGGELLLEQAAVWIDMLPPRAYMDLRGTSDVLLERFVRELSQQFILHGEAVRQGLTVTPAEWSGLQAAYQRGLAAALRQLQADTGTTLPAGDREARVTRLIDQLTADSSRWQGLPSALGAVLRARLGYRLHQPGLDRALRAAMPVAPVTQ